MFDHEESLLLIHVCVCVSVRVLIGINDIELFCVYKRVWCVEKEKKGVGGGGGGGAGRSEQEGEGEGGREANGGRGGEREYVG